MKRFIALLTCVILGTACFTGCANHDAAFSQQSYTADGEEITEVFVDVRDRKIEVLLSADNQIHIDYFENSKESYNISVSDGHTLTMTAQNQKEWTDYIGRKSAAGMRKISLSLPDKILTALNLSTTNETISLPALTIMGDLSLSSQGGNLVFDKLYVENTIRLHAKNGDISGTIIGNYDEYAISCDVKKGGSNLPSRKESGTKELNVSNNNGDIDIAFISD